MIIPTLLFTLQSIQNKFYSLTCDAVSYLGDGLSGLGSKLLRSSQMLASCSECPTLFIDADTVRGCTFPAHTNFEILTQMSDLNIYFHRLCLMDSWKK